MLAPHSKANVQMEMEIGTREGRLQSDVTLGTSDPAQPEIPFTLTAYIERPLGIDPSELLVYDAVRGETIEREMRVIRRVQSAESALPLQLSPLCDAVSAKYVSSSITDNLSGSPQSRILADLYRITIDTGALGAGPIVDVPVALRVSADGHDREDVIDVPLCVRFRHHSALLGPTSLLVSSGVQHGDLKVPVWSRDKTLFRIVWVTSSLPEIQVESLADQPSQRHEVLLDMAADAQSAFADSIGGEIAIYSDKWPDEPFRVSVVVLPAP
jgi:hypothetical protein